MKYSVLTLALAASLAVGSAVAGGGSPFYLGADVGLTSSDGHYDYDPKKDGGCGADDTCSLGLAHTNRAAHLYGGVQLSDKFAIEAGYVDLGETVYDDSIGLSQDTTGVTLKGVVRQRLGKTSPTLVYGKAGVVRWDSEVNVIDETGKKDVSLAQQTDYSATVGAGLEYEFAGNASFRAGWDRYFAVGEKDFDSFIKVDEKKEAIEFHTISSDVDVFSAGIKYDFL